jgi:hypothetical protein
VEAPHGGMWEHRWDEVRTRGKNRAKPRQPPLATSKGYAIYYGILALGAAGEFWLAGGHEHPVLFLIPLLPLLGAVYVCYRLYARPRGTGANLMSATTES